MPTKQTRYEEMTLQELTSATAEFDTEMVADSFKPLSATGKARHINSTKENEMRSLTDAMMSELDNLQEDNGLLKPSSVVKFAKSKRTALHSRFTWDDTEAAKQFRLEEARRVIRVSVIVLKTGKAPIRAFVSLKRDRSYDDGNGGYRAIVAVMSDAELCAELLEEAKEDMGIFRRKYSILKALKDVFDAMDGVE